MMNRYPHRLFKTFVPEQPAPPVERPIYKGPQAGWWHFLLPAGVYLLLATLYIFAIPVGESPDEPGHLQCIEQVAQYQRLPLMEPEPKGDVWWAYGRIVAGHMCYHMPLYYLAAGVVLKGVATVTNTAVRYAMPPTNEEFESQQAMFQHEAYAFGQVAEPVTLTSLRLLSVLLGMSLVGGSYLLVRRLVPAYPLFAVWAAVLSAGWPQLAYLSRAITNDALATAFAVFILLNLVNVARPARFVTLAILAALAVLAKLSVAFVIGAVIGVWLLEFVRFREQQRAYLQAFLVGGVVWALTLLLMAYHPLLRKHLAISAAAFSAATERAVTLAYWQEVLTLTLSSGWARLGWMNLPAPLWHAYAWWLVVGLATAAAFVLSWRLAKTEQQRMQLFICLIWVAAALLSYGRLNMNRLQPQFRFILPIVPVLTASTAVGCFYWVRQRPHLQWGIIAATAVFLIGYNVWFVVTAVQQAYGWHL